MNKIITINIDNVRCGRASDPIQCKLKVARLGTAESWCWCGRWSAGLCTATGIVEHFAQVSTVLTIADTTITPGRDTIHWNTGLCVVDGGLYLQLQSAVRVPTLVQVMSQAGPLVPLTGAGVVGAVVTGSEVHHPS